MTLSRLFSLGGMIRLMVIGGFVAALVVIMQSCQSPKTGLDAFSKGSLKRLEQKESPPPQPSLTFSGPEGAEMTLADYKGKVVLLNVWATWCAPCIVEMPMLNDLQAARGGDDFEVITISLDRHPSEPKAFFEDNGINNLTPWFDPSFSLNTKTQAWGLPLSIFYNRSGREVARVSGEVDWTSEEALTYIDHLLEK